MDSLPPELRIAVFEHLRKGDLISSALVCRAWRDVAWDEVMWRTFMIRLSGILKALSGKRGLRVTENTNFIPLPSNLHRFLGVAAKTTSIHLDITLADSLVKKLLEIADLTPGKLLFPSLSRLDCGSTPQHDLAHNLFVGSPIRNISIGRGGSKRYAVASRQLLSNLLATQPQVQVIVANELDLPEGLGIPQFWRLPELCSLTYCGHITYEEWTDLIQGCPQLNAVVLKGDARGTIPPNPNTLSAPSLRQLNLAEFTSFDLTIAIMESIDAPHLIALNFEATPRHRAEELEHSSANRARSAFRLVAERSQRLDYLTVSTSIKLGVKFQAAFCSLRTLNVVDWPPGYQLDDSDVELLSCSLPNLRRFHLEYAFPYLVSKEEIKTTPRALNSFARHCTNLTHLGLPLSATKPRDFVGRILTELVAFRENFKHLVLPILDLRADLTEQFVSFLIVQCPRLTDIEITLRIVDRQVSLLDLYNIQQKIERTYFQGQVPL
ncbi:hypothetical protein M407DRAFT_229575 [Tulasnella calospora MUT 4182]|uniref:F-box domain-containing protein n=1 Tax=Tulasnella calospora MUT 4182 TaxID=1051891 RepID=A0A0C3QXF2_9AGAM|nr:hypothetical protein M407DRAFT_229575 [Tulasnella calospora MUT 4182]